MNHPLVFAPIASQKSLVLRGRLIYATVGVSRSVVGLLILALSLLCAIPAHSQGTRADYERAANLRKLAENKVFRDRILANWLPGNTQFWYQAKTGLNSHEFILVDGLIIMGAESIRLRFALQPCLARRAESLSSFCLS